jgi:uncharacterized RDD family membrane protein YckC
MPPIRTHYDNLKIARNAPDAVIQTSYETLIQSFQNMELKEAQFFTKIVNESYEVLKHPVRRAIYDKWIEEQENPQREETQLKQQEVIESVASIEEYAGFWRRGFAFIVDIIAIIVFFYVVIVGFGISLHFFDGLMMINNPIWWFAALLAPIVLPVIMFESSNRQASIGKKLLGLKLINTSGNRIGFGRAISRLSLKVIFFYTFFLFPISCLMIIFSDKKQGIHDSITNTFVVIDSTRTSVKKRIVSFAKWLIVMVMLFAAMLYIGSPH